jgi:isoamylase
MLKNTPFLLSQGRAHPLGSTVSKTGVNFSIFSQDATEVQLLLFEKPDDLDPVQIINLDPIENRTFHFWHIFVEGAIEGLGYAYRIGGPYNPTEGHRYCKNKVIIDPYSKSISGKHWNRVKACGFEDNLHFSMRSIVVDQRNFDWEGIMSPNTPMEKTVIYELHVGGFTRDSSSKVKNPGTFAGVIEKIPYLKELGITAVELLPVFEFDENEVSGQDENGRQLINYWGYSTLSFFTPHSKYCVDPINGKHLNEFREMVKALHKEGIEVILDVVFNHSGEGNHEGPCVHFRGLDNKVYYFLSPENQEYYSNYSGCGNTINCNHPFVEKFIIDCLEFWVKEMHVDGFRFDEGSILSRGEDGLPMNHPPVIWELELSDVFANTKLIAEAWDAAGLYQIGKFPGYRWAEWNGMFRDDVRRFVKGISGFHGAVASRITGSFDIYNNTRHTPLNSINFITCHDGFTLMDLVSYNEKHNENNGESNKDGIDENFSWNCGIEGKSDNLEIIALRKKQIKNFFAILLLSRGVPMILMGDEVGRSQNGNNNAYCQNNEISWFNWNDFETNHEIFLFAKKMMKFRAENRSLYFKDFYSGRVNNRGTKDIEWHGCKLFSPGWDDSNSKVLSFTIGAMDDASPDIHVMMNFNNYPLSFEIPNATKKKKWMCFVDTSLDNSQISNKAIIGNEYYVNPYSVVILTLT